ncbi:MAG: T9SS type A sorting domain-containing protein [candidate division Zixibacteria bacterium]|nr:T9SS type A sorting domain-containing protein [candidate division Zixibacteria bacterium]
MNRKKSIGIFLALSMAGFLLRGLAFASPMDYPGYNGLHFELSPPTIFVLDTHGGDSAETAFVDFSLQFEYMDTTSAPDGDLDRIECKFYYDASKLVFETAELDSANWRWGFSWSNSVFNGDTNTLSLQFWNGDGVPAPETLTRFAVVKFTALEQWENTVNDLEFNQVSDDNNVEVDGNVYTPAGDGCWGDGSVTIADYQATFYLHDTTLYGALETVFEYPISATTNFYTCHINHQLVYDTTKLEFLGLADNYDDVFPGGCVGSGCPDSGAYPINVLLQLGTDNYPEFDPVPILDTETVIYSLRFKVKGNWEGQATPIAFVTDSCLIRPYHEYIIPFYDEVIVQNQVAYDYYGIITLADYTAEYYAELTENNICLGGDMKVKYEIKMKNNFPAGYAPWDASPDTGAIVMNLLLDEDLDYEQNTELTDDLEFWADDHTNGDHRLSLYQVPGSGGDDYVPAASEFEDIIEVRLEYLGDLPDNYNNRFITFEFTNTNPYSVYGDTAVVTDTSTHHATAKYPVSLSWDADPLEVPMGLFYGGGGYSKYDIDVTGHIYVKHNVDLSEFSLDVKIGPNYHISSIVPAENITASVIPHGRRLTSDSGFIWDATDNGYCHIATVYYDMGYCIEGHWYSNAVTFSNYYMKNAGGNAIHVVTNPGTVRGYCDGGYDPVDPIQNPISKEYDGIPTAYALHTNYPNPFNPATTIAYDVPASGRVRIDIHNILGQHVATLVDQTMAPGSYEIVWDGKTDEGRSVSSGIYLYIMRADNFTQTRKMTLLK